MWLEVMVKKLVKDYENSILFYIHIIDNIIVFL